jgi:hypothetical protein
LNGAAVEARGRALTGYVTEEKQRYYSTVGLDEKRPRTPVARGSVTPRSRAAAAHVYSDVARRRLPRCHQWQHADACERLGREWDLLGRTSPAAEMVRVAPTPPIDKSYNIACF